MIKCENISLDFDGKTVFNKLNIHVKKGEHLCIKGTSGKGKSTLLKLLQAYVVPNSGTIVINENRLNSSTIKEIRKLMVWIPQNINLPVENGIELAQMLNAANKLPDIEKLAEQLGLEKELIHKNFSKISGGQKQRIIIAICLALDKEIILMDEPTASLDDDAINLLIKTIRTFKDKTIVSASHNNLWVSAAEKTYQL